MPGMMAPTKNLRNKQIKTILSKELQFLKNIFSVISFPSHVQGNEDGEEENLVNEMELNIPKNSEEKELPKRARSIAELEEKLEKIKSQANFNLKNKLMKKSLNSKLNKKLKKRERLGKMKAKHGVKPINVPAERKVEERKEDIDTKPVFNNDGKIMFSKFDFSNVGRKDKKTFKDKQAKDPKNILMQLKEQEQKLQQLEENENVNKAKVIKEKIAWKNILQKAEGQKIKDDPILLKKSIKKMEQRKKLSKKQWDSRVKNVEQKKEERQKKRKENISKKKKEKKSKIVKTAIKRGRVVI